MEIKPFLLVISPVCKSCDFMYAAQIHNILWAIATVLSFYLVAKHLLHSTILDIVIFDEEKKNFQKKYWTANL